MLFARNAIAIFATLTAVTGVTLSITAAHAQTAAATYRFVNTLSALETNAPALAATDPLGLSGYGTDTVFGKTTNVYNFVGSTVPTNQAGLTLNTAGLLTPTTYSVEMVFKFTQNANGWRRIIDVENRKSDAGFYVNSSNSLAVYPESSASNTFALNTYYHVLIAVNNNNAAVYQNGNLAFSTATTGMNINNANNPNQFMNFFLDNNAASNQTEYSSGSVSLIRGYNSALTAQQAAAKYAEVAGAVTVPEANTVGLFASALLPIVGVAVRRRMTRKA